MARFSWFPFYVDDWLGGTCALLPAERGAYLSALLAQWQSGELRAIPDDPARLVLICGGNDFTQAVRSKFQEIKIKGQSYLRNKRLSEIWEKQKAQQDGRSKGGKTRADRYADTLAERGAETPAETPAETVLPARASPEPKEREKPPISPLPKSEMIEAFAEACCWDVRALTSKQVTAIQIALSDFMALYPAAMPVEVVAFGKWHFEVDWKGKHPQPGMIPEKWRRFQMHHAEEAEPNPYRRIPPSPPPDPNAPPDPEKITYAQFVAEQKALKEQPTDDDSEPGSGTSSVH